MPDLLPESINQLMQALVHGLLAILGGRLVGVYVGGSLTMGDFSEPSSDVDFLAVTSGPLSQEDALAVAQVHRELLRLHPDAARLEGDYAPREWLCAQGTIAPVPGCERGVFLPRVGEIMLSADNIYNLREQGVACYGPEPHDLFPIVTTADVRDAVRQMLIEPCTCSEQDDEAADALLNLLRSARAMESGLPTTKSEGARSMLAQLEARWHPAIQAALAIRRGEGSPRDGTLVRDSLPALHQVLTARYC